MGYVGAMDLKCCCCEPEEWKMWSNDVIIGKFDPTMRKEQEITELRSFIRAIAEALGTEAQGRDLIEAIRTQRRAMVTLKIDADMIADSLQHKKRECEILEARWRALNVK